MDEKLRILVVEDDPDLQFVVKAILRELPNAEVRAGSTGAEALRKLKDFRPDLLILDYRLPDTNGVDLLQQLQQTMDLHDVPVIFMTANPQEVVSRHPAGELIHIFPKPFDPLRLTEIVQHFLRRK